ncbi:MAG TPA: hypothetical protein VK633_00610, partial [Verrucomicrobiae bacterium]|nr:hypothetical protein [Verrucomicrobiae bacterium]
MNQTTPEAIGLSSGTKPVSMRLPEIVETENNIAVMDNVEPAEMRPLIEGHIVVTSIRPPSEQIRAFLRHASWPTILVADLKTPTFDSARGLDVLSVEEQRQQWPELALQLPWNHYSRKNLGYLQAIKTGAQIIFDTDDDNAPLEPWMPRPPRGEAVLASRGSS